MRILQTRTADMHDCQLDCQLGSVVQYHGPYLHSRGNRQVHTPWRVPAPRGAFPSVITSPEPSAGCCALELYVRYACTPGAPRAAPRRITAHARSSPSRTQVQRLGPLRGWAALLLTGWLAGWLTCRARGVHADPCADRPTSTADLEAGAPSLLQGDSLSKNLRQRRPPFYFLTVRHQAPLDRLQ